MDLTKMLFLKKAWVWLKTHWYLPILLVLLAITYFSGRARVNKVLKMFEASKESYEKQIKVINETHEQELKKQEELYNTYLNTMKKLEKEHSTNLDSLDKEKKKKLDEMVKKYKGTPKELEQELGSMFGINIWD
tara:strand:+ start:1448 stop:1849 length:402 start_codon:yes stop_codon:yes gene_type:complete